MKTFLFLFFFTLSLSAQVTIQYAHDPTLDVIAGQAAGINWGVNQSNKTPPLTITDLNTNSDRISSVLYNEFNNPTNMSKNVTNRASLQFTNFINAWSTNFPSAGLYETNPDSFGYSGVNGGTNLSSFSLGTFNQHTFYIDLSLASLSSNLVNFLALIRKVIMALVWMIFYFMALREIQTQIAITTGQRQTTGNKQSILGTDISGILGPVATALISTTLFFAVGFISTNIFMVSAKAGAVTAGIDGQTLKQWISNAYQSVPAWDVMTALFPLTNIFGAIVTYFTYRYYAMWPVFQAVRMVILWCVS